MKARPAGNAYHRPRSRAGPGYPEYRVPHQADRGRPPLDTGTAERESLIVPKLRKTASYRDDEAVSA